MNARNAMLAATLLFPLIACSDDTPPDWVPEARQQSGQLAQQLVATLTEALSEEGPAGGVQICKVEAPKIAARVSGSRFEVARTALRVRNPDNAADGWEASVLRRFKARMAEGADPAGLEAWEVETVDGNRVGRYMKAIPMGSQCVVCHGENINPELAETIDKLYPQDEATGFAPGELRGAFTVTVDLSASD
ncbi:MAG: DUF3365 domain-containing protein [Wenzhouxiangellaceae bacterium]|nr:DUF3365 domain-containing protein [Wenzhouxiangellaceae bacterium]